MTKTIMRVYLDLTYHCYSDQESIEQVKRYLMKDIENMIKYNEIWDSISFEIDPNAIESDVLECFRGYDDDLQKDIEEEYINFAPEEIED